MIACSLEYWPTNIVPEPIITPWRLCPKVLLCKSARRKAWYTGRATTWTLGFRTHLVAVFRRVS